MSTDAPEVPAGHDWLRPALARAAFCAFAASVAVTVAWVLSHTRVFLAWVLVWPLVGAILVRLARIVWRTTFRPEPTTSAVALETVLIAVGVALGVLTTTAVLGSPQSWGSNAASADVLGETRTRIDTPTTVGVVGQPGAFAGLTDRDRQSLAAQALRVGAAILAGAGAAAPGAATTPVEPTSTTTTTTTAADPGATTTAAGSGPSTTGTSVAGSHRVTTSTAAITNATVVQRGTTTTTRAPGTVVATVTTPPAPVTTAAPTTPAPTVATTPAPTTAAPTTAAPTTTEPPPTTEAPTTTAAPG